MFSGVYTRIILIMEFHKIFAARYILEKFSFYSSHFCQEDRSSSKNLKPGKEVIDANCLNPLYEAGN